jgi:hypothetical protein
MCRQTGLPFPFRRPSDVAFDHPDIEKPNELSGRYDYFVCNSVPMSGQFDYDESAFAEVVRRLAAKGSVITTRKVPGVPCTMDKKLNTLQIANVASTSRNVIGINTGPMVAALNRFTLRNAERIVVMDLRHGFAYGEPNKVE